ncbi:MAG: polyphosphate kinase 2 family protein [Flavisolibacter sp.]
MSYLKGTDTKAPKNLDKDKTKKETKELIGKIDHLQNVLFASGSHSVLVVLQGMDASGKDGVIGKVFGKINPQGIDVSSFKKPTEEEQRHDFLWRIHQRTPSKGKISIFNRSHYEDVVITRVHGWCDDTMAKQRFKAINDFEEMLFLHNPTLIFKFYLHISQEEQQKRFKERQENEIKKWKFNDNDLKEAAYWDKYMEMYEDVFKHCNLIPWHIIPSDQNWYKENRIATLIYEALVKLDLKYPKSQKA